MEFNPNNVAVDNGNFFGFPKPKNKAKVVLLPVPWDVTVSYGSGTANGPEAIQKASLQLDFYDFDIPEVWNIELETAPFDSAVKKESVRWREKASKAITLMEQGLTVDKNQVIAINKACEELNLKVENKCTEYLNNKQIVGVVGGDHSVPLGAIKALSAFHNSFGILHIDAHADLRNAYEEFTYSHASIMYNALQIEQVSNIVQVGIRDVCEEEMTLAKQEKKITQYSNHYISNSLFSGKTWSDLVQKIIESLPEKVYISFDIDGLSPENCPNTGTPVPGGLSFNEAMFLLTALYKSGKQIIGFDLCEVAPGNSIDENIGARVLWKLCSIAGK